MMRFVISQNGRAKSRWDWAIPRGHDFMAAMAQDPGPSSLANITARMGKRRPSNLLVVFDMLIKRYGDADTFPYPKQSTLVEREG